MTNTFVFPLVGSGNTNMFNSENTWTAEQTFSADGAETLVKFERTDTDTVWSINLGGNDFNIYNNTSPLAGGQPYFTIPNNSGGVHTRLDGGGDAFYSERLDTGQKWALHHAANDWTIRDYSAAKNYFTISSVTGRIGLGYVDDGSCRADAKLDVMGTTDFVPIAIFERGTGAGVADYIQVRTTGATVGDIWKIDESGWCHQSRGVEIHGDAGATLTYGTSAYYHRFNVALTADRTVTLATPAVSTGAAFKITRTGGGAFNLNVGGGPTKALATGQWCEVAWDGSNWYLVAFGSL